MGSPINLTAIVLLASAPLLAIFFVFIYRQKRQEYLLALSAAWLLLTLYYAGPALSIWVTERWMRGLNEWLLVLAALAFYSSARLYAHLALAIKTTGSVAAAMAVWSFAHAYGTVSVSPILGAGLIFFLVASTFTREERKQESRVNGLLAVTFSAWGVLCLAMVVQSSLGLQGRDLFPLMFLPELFAGALMIMAVYEEERRSLERNMLALSSLNLATWGFASEDIMNMIGPALERVLNVVRIPSGVLCLQHGEAKGSGLVTGVGVDDTLCTAIQKNGLDEYTVNLVARLGGLFELRDLADDSTWETFEKEDAFRELRQLLLGQGLRTAIGISLQAKERVLGVVMLGTPDDRNFTPAERRLLLALGQQIGMAVENSYLIKQISRRSEELHILNEIGRALSSTLDLDALLERIYSEMHRFLDAGSFFIAFQDQQAREIRFVVEVVDGERLPKRSLPAEDHLVEFVVRSGQPLLIRARVEEESQRLGFQAPGQMGSVCAVPLILYDNAVGVMAMHSPKEWAFDEDDVKFLRLLASEAGVAIENARLFAEKQKKSLQLTLINNISRHAITSLDPGDMLPRIAAEMEKHLHYDHIGIAILDYSTKELVVRAEAGPRREALGRRFLLDEGLVGQVARSGQAATIREVNASGPQLVLPGSTASVALPVSYGEQFLGVLYVESDEPCDFHEQDVSLLRTLADLFAGALHNALTFQKAQEQAITDGLTGLKTHRFLMEALSSEWKRSTRANRPFSLVLMDLDRFKFVNDFYGHLEGDIILQRVGHILEQNCRRSDVVARYGGDEFVILMPETAIDHARQLANKLRGWIASDPLLHDKNITASFGIAAFPIHGATPQELIQVADSSMYLSKHQGGNSVSSTDEHDSGNRKKWKKDVLEAYLGVTLKRLFSTGPEAFEEIYRRLEEFTRSLSEHAEDTSGDGPPPAVVETVTSLALAIDAKDHYTQGHSRKVSAYAVMIAQSLGMNQPEIEEIRLAGLLHDIGKVGIPEAILNKSGPLDASEWETMKTHADLGAKILEPLKPMERIRDMVRHHHEFYDGTGYPSRLEGEKIPHGARVIAVADAYDTITSERAYKKPRKPEDAFAELERCASNQFDPEIVRAFIEVMRRAPSPAVEAIAEVSRHTSTAR